MIREGRFGEVPRDPRFLLPIDCEKNLELIVLLTHASWQNTRSNLSAPLQHHMMDNEVAVTTDARFKLEKQTPLLPWRV
jgi:hypothetical protein